MGREAYNNSTFGEVVDGRRKRILDSQREIPQGAVVETVNRHRHDIDHEMAEQVEALERSLSACELKHLRNMVRVRAATKVGIPKPTSTNSQVESCNSGWKRLMWAGT